jgi:hypothetical protein
MISQLIKGAGLAAGAGALINSARHYAKITAIRVLGSVFGLIGAGFSSAALWIYWAEKYGSLNACLWMAATFFIASLVIFGIATVQSSRILSKRYSGPSLASGAMPVADFSALLNTRGSGTKTTMIALVAGLAASQFLRNRR